MRERGDDLIPVPMEILVLELDLSGEKRYILGYEDSNEILHELNPYNMGGNNNELDKECVARWVNFSDVIEQCGKDLFGERNGATQMYEF